METVLEIAQRGDREDELLVGKVTQQLGKRLDNLFRSEKSPVETLGRELMAVADHLMSVVKAIDPSGAQAKDNPFVGNADGLRRDAC